MFDGRQAGVIDLSDFDVPVFRHLILVMRLKRHDPFKTERVNE